MPVCEQLPGSRAISTISHPLQWGIVGVILHPIQKQAKWTFLQRRHPFERRLLLSPGSVPVFYVPPVLCPRFKGCSEIIVTDMNVSRVPRLPQCRDPLGDMQHGHSPCMYAAELPATSHEICWACLLCIQPHSSCLDAAVPCSLPVCVLSLVFLQKKP